jgi:hypothetical protein
VSKDKRKGSEDPTQRPGASAERAPAVEWGELEADPWHADSSLPASEALTGIPEEAEPEPEAEDEDAERDDDEAEDGAEPEAEAPPSSAANAEAGARRRSKTIARKQMLRERRRLLAQGKLPEIVDYERPLNRSECRQAERPCLYVSCRYHLYLDVNPNTGSIKINFPDKQVWDLEETCALDVAERGGVTLEEVGDIMNLTRERIRQVEVAGLEKLRSTDGDLETFLDGRELPLSPSRLPIVGD